MWLINLFRGKMIRKWMVVNTVMTLLIILLVGFSVKEFACYQFAIQTDSASAAEQFRTVITQYLLLAGALTLLIGITVHFFFAKKILQPLQRLASTSQTAATKDEDGDDKASSVDEVHEIAQNFNDVSQAMTRLDEEKKQFQSRFSHELRTPLTNINGYLQGIDEGVFPQDEHMHQLLKQECAQLIQSIEHLEKNTTKQSPHHPPQ